MKIENIYSNQYAKNIQEYFYYIKVSDDRKHQFSHESRQKKKKCLFISLATQKTWSFSLKHDVIENNKMFTENNMMFFTKNMKTGEKWKQTEKSQQSVSVSKKNPLIFSEFPLIFNDGFAQNWSAIINFLNFQDRPSVTASENCREMLGKLRHNSANFLLSVVFYTCGNFCFNFFGLFTSCFSHVFLIASNL